METSNDQEPAPPTSSHGDVIMNDNPGISVTAVLTEKHDENVAFSSVCVQNRSKLTRNDDMQNSRTTAATIDQNIILAHKKTPVAAGDTRKTIRKKHPSLYDEQRSATKECFRSHNEQCNDGTYSKTPGVASVHGTATSSGSTTLTRPSRNEIDNTVESESFVPDDDPSLMVVAELVHHQDEVNGGDTFLEQKIQEEVELRILRYHQNNAIVAEPIDSRDGTVNSSNGPGQVTMKRKVLCSVVVVVVVLLIAVVTGVVASSKKRGVFDPFPLQITLQQSQLNFNPSSLFEHRKPSSNSTSETRKAAPRTQTLDI